MIEPAVFFERFRREEAQGIPRMLSCLGSINPAVLRSNTKPRQAKAGSSSASHVQMILVERRAICASAIRNETGVGISLVPKIAK